MNDNYRRIKIAEKIEKLITDNPSYTVAFLLGSILRKKYTADGKSDPWNMTDEEISTALESILEEDLNE